MTTKAAAKMTKPADSEAAPEIGGRMCDPAFADFKRLHDRNQAQVVSTKLIADLETPVSAYLKLAKGLGTDGGASFLFESVEGGAVRGRYSMIGLRPDLIWRAHGTTAQINRNPATAPSAFETDSVETLKSLRALITSSEIDLPAAKHCAPSDRSSAVLITMMAAADQGPCRVFIGDADEGGPLAEGEAEERAVREAVEAGVRADKKTVLIKAEKNVRLRDVSRIGAVAVSVSGIELKLAVIEKE